MRPPKLRPSRPSWQASYGIANIFQQRPSAILNFKNIIFDHMTAIVVRICCCIPNFIKIGSLFRPPDANKCWMSSAPLLGNGRCHGNLILADMSGSWWDATTQVASQSVHWQASYGVSNIFQQRPSAILNFKNFNIWSVAVIVVLICCCIPNFNQIGSRVRELLNVLLNAE